MKHIQCDNFKPVGGRILVTSPPEFEESLTKSGIILAFPLSDDGYFRFGKVLAIDLTDEKNHGIEIGDRILYDRHYNEELVINGESAVLVRRLDTYGSAKA